MDASTPATSGHESPDVRTLTRKSLARRIGDSPKFHVLRRAVPDALLVVDGEGEVVYADERCERVLRSRPGDLVGRPLRRLLCAEDAERLPSPLQGGPWEVRFGRCTSPWTSLAATQLTALDTPDTDGDILNHLDGYVLLFARPASGAGTEAGAHDVSTSSPRDEVAAALEQAADAVIITDGRLDRPGPIVRYVNEAFVRMTGFTREEVIGRNPRFMQGPMTNRTALDRLRRQLEAGLSYRGELVNVKKDGTPYLIEIEIMPIRDAAGEIARFVSTQRDVTEQRRLEAEVLGATSRAQAEVARELHDGVGQVLAGTAFLLHGLADDLRTEGSAHAAQASRSAALIQEAQQQARALARGLDPVAVASDGLAAELERLAAETAAAYDVDCRYICARAVAVQPDDRAADLYRIAQEAVRNAVRHGRPSAIQICLEAPATDDGVSDGLAALVIEDDGAGVAGDVEGGLGISTMRYRARRLGGSLEVGPRPEGGTMVQVRFPVHAEAVYPLRRRGA